jgi:hypothetical protein
MLDVRTVVVPANRITPVPMSGSHVYVRTCSAASVGLGFDADSVQICIAGEGYPSAKPFNLIRVQDLSGAGTTVVLVVSDLPVVTPGGFTPAAVAALQVSLTLIAASLAGVATMTQGTLLTLAATGGAGTLIFAANATRKKLSIQAALTNTGTVYLGNAAAHCSDVDSFAQLAAGQPCPEDRYLGAVYGVGSDAAQQVVRYEE